MYKYVAVAIMIGVATGPASAVDVGGGGKVGGLGVGAGVSAGQQGVSVGVGASVDGVGGTTVGASVGTGNGSLGVGVDAGGNLGNASASVSTGTKNPSAAAAATSGSPAPDNTAVVSANSATRTIDLPSTLKPSKAGRGELGRIITGYPFGPLASLKAKPGTTPAVVSACRAAIVSAATPLGALRVSAVSAGPMRQRHAALMAPIEVRIQYARQGDIQVRQAKVTCRLDAAGRVTAVT
ncbi:hypothetical protein ACWGTI_13330 [Mesorhizobium sp. ArgA1]